MKLGEVLKIARISKGMSHRDMADISGVSFATISQIETGKIKSVGVETLIKLCHAMKMKAYEMVKIYEDSISPNPHPKEER